MLELANASSFVSGCFRFSGVTDVTVRHGLRYTEVDPSGCTAPPSDLAVLECGATAALRKALRTFSDRHLSFKRRPQLSYMPILSDRKLKPCQEMSRYVEKWESRVRLAQSMRMAAFLTHVFTILCKLYISLYIYIYIHVLDEFFTFPLKFSKVYISFCRIFSRKAAEFSTSVGWVLALSSVLEGCALAVWSQCGNRRMTMWRSFLVDPFQIATTWVSGKSWIYQPWHTSTGFFKTSW